MLEFETERLILRPFLNDDADVVAFLTSDIELARTTLHIPYPYPEGFATLWITTCTEKMEKGSSYSFAIILKETNELIGCVTLAIALNHKRGELAYWIGRPYWDNGYATEAAKKMLQFAFMKLRLNRVWACVMKKNHPSIEVIEKLGLYYEGTFVQHVYKWGEFEDVVYYGITKEQYESLLRIEEITTEV